MSVSGALMDSKLARENIPIDITPFDMPSSLGSPSEGESSQGKIQAVVSVSTWARDFSASGTSR